MNEASSEIVESLGTHLTKYGGLQAAAPWATELFSTTLDQRVSQELEAWSTRSDRAPFSRYGCLYSPEWFEDHLHNAEVLLDQALARRTDYLQLESQALILATQYATEVGQRQEMFKNIELHTRNASKQLGLDQNETKAYLKSVADNEKFLELIQSERQKLHRINGGALNFAERLTYLSESYVDTFKDLIDRAESASIGLATSMQIAIDPMPRVEAFDGKSNPIALYRSWLLETRRRVNAAAYAESVQRVYVFLIRDGIVPDLLQKLAAVTQDGRTEIAFQLKLPDLEPQAPVGIASIYPLLVTSQSAVKHDDITKENSYLHSIRLEERASIRSRQARTAAKLRLRPPSQRDAGHSVRWSPTERIYSNIPIVADRTFFDAIASMQPAYNSRLSAAGTFTMTFEGSISTGDSEFSIAEMVSIDSAEMKLKDVVLVVDCIYRNKTIPQ